MKQGWLYLWRENLKRNYTSLAVHFIKTNCHIDPSFKLIDGTTRSPTTFTGPVGKLCGSNYQDLLQVEFASIGNFYFTAEAMDDQSGDQRLLLEYAVGISRGKVNSRFAAWKIGPLNQ